MPIYFRNYFPTLFITALAVFLTSIIPATAFGAANVDDADAHRLVGLIGYVGADYAEAVQDGEVIDEFEYEEQNMFLADARELAGHAGDIPPAVNEPLDHLQALVHQKADPAEVQQAAQLASRAIVEHYNIILSPKALPNLEQGAELYAQNCASCHGDLGDGDTPAGRALSPEAADFTDPDLLEALSPYRAFNTTTFGVSGTGMAGYPQLTERERWDLAFYVMSLGHGGVEAASVSKADLPGGFDPTLDTLASNNDADLAKHLVEAGATPEAAEALVQYLRVDPPFSRLPGQTNSIAITKEHVDAARKAWKDGDTTQARKELLSGYLEGFEQVETRLGSLDQPLVRAVEGKFMDLRAGLKSADQARVARDFDELDKLLNQAAQTLDAASMDAWATAVASGVIILREGLEIILLLALLLGVIGRLGLAEAKKYIHYGWVAAVVAGVATWIAAQRLIIISGVGRELLEGAIGILAALVLFSLSYWFMSKIHGEKWVSFIKVQIEERVKSGNLWAIAGLSFMAVYRELLEVMLFFQAIALESSAGATPILAGVVVAGVILAAIAYLILKVGARLPLKPFFALSGAALYALAIIMMGSGLHALVEAGILPVIRAPGFELRWLGIYPQLIPLLAQGIMLLLALVWATSVLRQRKIEKG